MAKRKKIISDEQMQQMEAAQAPKKKTVISDEQMAQMEAQEQGAPPPVGAGTKARAALSGFGESATFGYLPQATAAIGGLIPDPSAGVTKELEAKGFRVEEPKDDYLQRRDLAIAKQQKLAGAAPGYHAAGQIGGALATIPAMGALGKVASRVLPSAVTATKAGLLGRTAQAAGTGAAMGLVASPGDVPGEVAPIQLGRRLEQAAGGAAFGAVAAPVVGAVSRGLDLIKGLPQRLTDYSQLKAFKSTGAMLKDYRKAANFNKIGKIGDNMIKKGLVKPGSSFEDVAAKANELKTQAGRIISDVYKKAQESIRSTKLTPEQSQKLRATQFNTEAWADDLSTQFGKTLKGKPGGIAAKSKMDKLLEELKENGPDADLADIQDFKAALDDIIKYNHKLVEEPLTKQYLFKVRTYLKDKIQARVKAMDDVLGGNALKSLKEANEQYGIWAEVSRISGDRVLRESTNRFLSLTDSMAMMSGGVAGAATGALVKGDIEGAIKGAALGMGLGMLHKGVRLYGNPVLTTGLAKAGRALKPLEKLAPAAAAVGRVKARPGLIGAAAQRLGQSPEYGLVRPEE